MSEELERRIKRLEDINDKTIQELSDISTQLKLLTQLMSDIPERMRVIEVEVSNSKLIMKALQFLSATIVGSSVIMIISYIFGGG
jgi:indole-3-glycerol phosphate synthase